MTELALRRRHKEVLRQRLGEPAGLHVGHQHERDADGYCDGSRDPDCPHHLTHPQPYDAIPASAIA